tara:strand:+ start:1936 stop:5136 length:3201 start_codon:yes stop_codon:yes gene_type:complete
MGKKLLIDATHAEETRVVVVDGNKVEEFDFETIHKRQLAGNIYLAKVTRVEPSLQAAFVDYGGNRHGFLAFAEIHPDYYQIPVADRKALLDEERALARAQDDDGAANGNGNSGGGNGTADRGKAAGNGGRRQRRRRTKDPVADAVQTSDTATEAAAESAPVTRDAAPDNAQETAVDTAVDLPIEAQATATDAPVHAADMSGPAAEPRKADAVVEPDISPAAQPDAAEPDAQQPEIAAQDAEVEPLADAQTPETRSAPGSSADDSVKGGSIAANSDGLESRTYGAMDVVDLGDDDDGANAKTKTKTEPEAEDEGDDVAVAAEARDDEPQPYRAADHASDVDDQVESVADEDVTDEVRPPRRIRTRRYKIQEVIKVRQIMLVQVVKEERGNKGAALTTYLSLAGRYCVLMPNTARGGGISRKITNAADRKKLKEIAGEISVPEGAGLIIRTAGANRTKAEIRRDYEYLFRMWEQIRELTLKSIAPAPIYEEGNLIKRVIRDLYNRDIDEVLVEGEGGYRTAKDFMKMIMPSHAKNVQLYRETMPLFARFQVESYLASMFNPTVQLKSGGYIVIGVTEALVAIDVNSGKSTREGSIEDTALKTNLEAADEVARQLRLRDLAGLIVIDFIDMEERKNNAAVEKRMKDALRTDRARIQVGRISAFGLMEMSRQRLRPGMIEATTQPCPACHGTGLIRSDNSLALQILRALEEEGTRNRSREVLVKAPIDVVNYLFNAKREHMAQIELRYGMAIRLEADPSLVSPDYVIEKFKTATRIVTAPSTPVVSLSAQTMSEIDDEFAEEEDDSTEIPDQSANELAAGADSPDGEDAGSEGGKRKRRRRRRRRGQGGEQGPDDGSADAGPEGDDAGTGTRADAALADAPPADAASADAPPADATVDQAAQSDDAPASDEKPARKRRTRTRARKPADGEDTSAPASDGADAPAPEAEAEAPKKRTRRRKPKAEADARPAPLAEPSPEPTADLTADDSAPTAAAHGDAPADAATDRPEPVADPTPEAETTPPVETVAAIEEQPDPSVVEASESLPEPASEAAAPANPEPSKPRRRGWWSR